MPSKIRFAAFFLLCILPIAQGARAAVWVDTVEGRVRDFDRGGQIRANFRAEILAGAYDDRRWKFPVVTSRQGAQGFTLLSSRTFSALPSALQDHMVAYLAAGDENLRACRTTVDATRNDLIHEPVIKALGVDATSLGRKVPAEFLLSGFARNWAYRLSPPNNGVNCYFTSIASLFLNWVNPRHMGVTEFTHDLRGYFTQVAAPEKWGDVIYLFKNDHAFIYLGRDRHAPGRAIVFTKNGYQQSHFLFMSLADVVSLYGAREALYFRRNITPSAPSELEAPDETKSEREPHGEISDAALEKYMVQNPPERSAALVLAP